MLISGNRARDPQQDQRHHDQRHHDQRHHDQRHHDQRQPHHTGYQHHPLPPPATFQQVVDVQGSIAYLQNEMAFVKASMVSMMQMLTSLMHRVEGGEGG